MTVPRAPLLALLAGAVSASSPVLAPAQQPSPSAPVFLAAVADAYPAVAPDGARIVFQSNRLGNYDLYVSNIDGTAVRQLTSGPAEDVTPIWSPDGARIVFASNRDGNEDIWVVNADGTGLRNVTRHPGGDSHPSWSPDGTRIVFCSTRGDGENDDIYTMNADGSGLRRLTDNGLVWDTFPSFSPDGSRILFRRLLRTRTPEGTLTNSEVMVMDADGTGAVNLTRHGHFDGWPSWSPDGARIAFSSNRSDVYQIYVMSADGSNVIRVTDSPYTEVRPQWTPDGRSIVYNRERDGGIQILRIALPRPQN